MRRLTRHLVVGALGLFVLSGAKCRPSDWSWVRKVVDNTLELRVVSFNILAASKRPSRQFRRDYGPVPWWRNRKAWLASKLAASQADIICLQEVEPVQYDYLKGELDKYDSFVAFRDGLREGEGVPIFFRKDRFELAESGRFWFANRPWDPDNDPGPRWASSKRICVFVHLVEASTGKSLYVYNLHLKAGADRESLDARLNSAVLLAEVVGDRRSPTLPPVIVGDFNAMPNDPPIRHVMTSLGLMDTYAEAHPEDGQVWVDYVLAPAGSLTTYAKTEYIVSSEGKYLSDHKLLRSHILLIYP